VSRRKYKLSSANVIKYVRAAYVSLWKSRARKSDKLNDEIENMLNQSDPIVKSVLKYILFLRSKYKDVEIRRESKPIYDPRTGDLSYKPSKFILIAATSSIKSHWLYFYMPEVKDFTVLRMSKKLITDVDIQRMSGKASVLYTEVGKAYHYVGINKIKKIMAIKKEPVKIKFIKVKINYKLLDITGNNLELPCITEEDFEQYKKLYKCLLRDLGIVPPLIVELPPSDADNKPGMGLILPIRYNENAIRTYILPIDTILTLNAESLSFSTFDKFVASLDDLVKRHNLFPPWHVKVENIKCEGLWTYLYNKNIEEYLRLLMDELRASSNDLSEAINNGELRKNYVNLIYELHERKCDYSLNEYINNVWQQKSRSKKDVSKKEVIQDLLNDADSAAKLLNYLPKPIAIELYGLDYIKRVIKALLCLRSQSH
jgi:hypothetical protein